MPTYIVGETYITDPAAYQAHVVGISLACLVTSACTIDKSQKRRACPTTLARPPTCS